MRTRALLVPTLVVVAVGCGADPKPGPTHQTSDLTATHDDKSTGRNGPPIVVQISLPKDEVDRDADLEVAVRIENHSPDPVILLAEEVTAPAALFEVRDAMGQKVLPTSAPVPTGGKRVVDPGKAIDIKMTLAGMFTPGLKPGEYSVRLRRIDSTPRRFKVRPPL